MVGEFTVTVGKLFTVTVPVAVELQPFASPVTVYVVVLVGVAVTVAPVVEANVGSAVQIYPVAPLAVSVADCPTQIAVLFTVTTGKGVTVTVTVAVPVHEFVVPITVYVVVEAGLAVTVEPVVEESVAPGLQE